MVQLLVSKLAGRLEREAGLQQEQPSETEEGLREIKAAGHADAEVAALRDTAASVAAKAAPDVGDERQAVGSPVESGESRHAVAWSWSGASATARRRCPR